MKGQIKMSNQEVDRISILESLIRKEIKQKAAAKLLGLSTRQIRRIKKKYQRFGVSGLIHANRGRVPNNKISDEEVDKTIKIIKDKYYDFGPTLAHEKLVENHGVKFSVERLRQAMIDENIWQAKKKKQTRIFQLRERRDSEGELVQIDGSPHDWFEGRAERCTLLVYIDDATGKLLHLEFAKSESTLSYFKATKTYLKNHGKPLAFYADKHSVFRINTSKGGSSAASDSNGLTQFGRAMKELVIKIIFANTPQAKGRVEKVNLTLQDRLVKEMRLQGLSSIKEANEYLPTFIKTFNQKFAVIPKENTNAHRPLKTDENLDEILVIKETRTLSKSLSFHFEQRTYQIRSSRPSYALRRVRVTVTKNEVGQVDVFHNNKKLNYEIIDIQPKAEITNSKLLNVTIDEIKQQEQLALTEQDLDYLAHSTR